MTEQTESGKATIKWDTTATGAIVLRNPHVLRSLLELAKLRIVALVTFCGAAAMIVASRFAIPPVSFIAAVVSFSLGSGGCNAVTSYNDREIDAVMERTSRRPIPQGWITPRYALLYGVLLTISGLAISWFLGPLIFVIGLIGVLDNIVVYSLLAKKRNAANVILGSFSGGAPVLIGWMVAKGTIDLMGIIAAVLVVLWIPNHIWNLALYHAEDYKKAAGPMLPALVDMKKAARCIVLTVILLVGVSITPYALGFLGTAYLLITIPFSVLLAAGNIRLALTPNRKLAWRMFKISSPYLLVLFFAMMIDRTPYSLL
nr:heme o synthase [Candidatus Njordarchaeota archaeon]